MDHLSEKSDTAFREIVLESGEPIDVPSVSNYAHTKKYSFLTFLPFALADRLLRLPSLWFLLVIVLETDPFDLGYTPSYVNLGLFSGYLGVSLAQGAAEMYRGRARELSINQNSQRVWRRGRFVSCPCKDLRVGECVLIAAGVRIPGDMLLVASSAVDGSCYVNTIRTLGENSLVMKTAVRETQRLLPNTDSPNKFNFDRLDATVKVLPPNSDFLSFSGSIKLKPIPRAVPLKYENFLLRGCVIQGEEWILGIMLYAGMETKFWSNVTHTVRRASFLMRMLTIWTIISVSSILFMSSLHILLQYALSSIPPQPSDFLFYFLLYPPITPLPLFLSLDLLRLIHARQCRDRSNLVTVNSNCLVENLGRVNYILADKTGTVTQGRLELIAVLVGFQMYTKQDLFPRKDRRKMKHLAPLQSPSDIDQAFSFEDLRQELAGKSKFLRRFCECIALCNSVIPLPDGLFRGTSKDEEALMEAAKDLGFTLHERSAEEKIISIFDECLTFQVVCVKNFSADVKRMRILVKQEYVGGPGTLFLKGSYWAMKGMMKLEDEERKLLERKLERMSEKGLRTMVLCYRHIDPDYLADIESRVLAIKTSHSLSANTEGSLEVLFMELEQNLSFLGVTGVRDHLQPGVSESVRILKTSGIETWLVSGEGESNTIACAKELGLISNGCRVVSLSGLKKTEDCLAELSKATDDNYAPDMHQTEASVILPDSFHGDKLPQSTLFAVSIDGQTLETAVKDDETQSKLLTLLFTASSVCFNTMHPSHKRKAVTLLRSGVSSRLVLLAIGDGVNDIPMLLEADISVGLRGDRAEGVSSVNSASFAGLPALLLRSGRQSSVRMSKCVLLMLYAQGITAMIKLEGTVWAGFTPNGGTDGLGTVLFGLVFCVIPVLVLCGMPVARPNLAFEEQMDLYRSNAVLNTTNMLRYGLLAVLHFLSISGLVLSACFDRQSSVISTDELDFVCLAASVGAVTIHCQVESSRLVFLPVAILNLGLFYTYSSLDLDRFSVLSSVSTEPKFVLSCLAAVVLCAVVSLSLTKLSTFADIQNLISSKVTPASFHNSDLKSIKRTSKSSMILPQPHTLKHKMTTNDTFAISQRMCAFENSQMESRFQTRFYQANIRVYWRQLALVFVQSLIPFLLTFAFDAATPFQTSLKSTFFTSVFLLSLLFVVKNIAQCSAELFALAVTIVTFVLNVVMDGLNSYVFFYVMACVMLFLREKWGRNVGVALAATAMLACSEAITVAVSEEITSEDVVPAVGAIVAHSFTLAIAAKVAYENAISARKQYKLVEESKAKIEQSDTILGYLLPDFVCNQVKDGIRYIAEDQGEVSVIFIDICDFESICSNYSPPELIGLLDEIFQRIDELCSSLHVAKIETVGKTYLACAGLRDFEFEHTGEYMQAQHAKRAIELSFSILRNFRATTLSTSRPLSFKIGINSGAVIAGVVGHHKPQFVLVGDTVNTASRMATTLDKPDSIQISANTYQFVSGLPEYRFDRRLVEVKGKGEMTTFTVTHTQRHHTYVLQEGVDTRGSICTSSSLRLRRLSLNVNDISKVEGMRDALLMEKVSLCSFATSRQEADFNHSRLADLLPTVRLGLSLLSLGLFLLFSVRVMAVDSGLSIVPTVLYILFAAVVCGLAVFWNDLIHRKWSSWCIIGVLSCGSWVVFADQMDNPMLTDNFVAIIIGFFLVLGNFASGLLFRPGVIMTALVLAPHVRFWAEISMNSVESGLFIVIFSVQTCVQLYFSERSQRVFYNTSKRAIKEIWRTEQLLTQMIPFHTYENLKHGEWSTDRLTDVTILFADISGFTSWASNHSPARVIGKLGKIFEEFDKVCVENNVYKVCTIGDCYVALSSTSNSLARSPGDECVRMIRFAASMLQVVDRICSEEGELLKMRVGVHVGEAIAGITGSKIVRYDVYGPDVITANKMESSGCVDYVNVSEQAKNLLEQTAPGVFAFEFNMKVEMPEINRNCDSYFVTRRLTASI